jgi:molybdopterin molybdotransferase
MSMLPVEEALERVLELCAPLSVETVSVEDAVGRALVEAFVARRTLPPWDNSAMDGYAVRTADHKNGPVPLEVIERIFAGQRPALPLDEGCCARIMTGAPLPIGADAVVAQERVQVLDEERIEVLEVPAPGANIRLKGEDMEEGHRLLSPGTPVGVAEAGALWSQGVARVTVRRRPRVAIVASGDELCNAWEEPHQRIVDINSPMIAQGVLRAGGLPTTFGVVPDRLDALQAAFGRGLEADVLLTVSGSSVGERDYTREALAELGVAMDFWKVAMKPGKPLSVGRKDGTLVFGLPGNPISALVTFELFVRPALRALQGLPTATAALHGRAATTLKKSPGLRHFLRATVIDREGALWATPLANQSSGALTSALGATHLISLDPEVSELGIGSEIKLLPLSWGG